MMRRLMALLGAFALSSCFFQPGAFEAALVLSRDGGFSYRYEGQILAVTGGGLMKEMMAAADEFDPDDELCFGPTIIKAVFVAQEEGEARECTPTEIEQKRRQWEEGRPERAREQEEMAKLFGLSAGGTDMLDPSKYDEFATRLETLDGWTRVVHRGDGVFDVLFETSGRLDQNFAWPMMPGAQAVLPFVQLVREKGGRVRFTAPGFAANEMAQAMAALQMAGQMASSGDGEPDDGSDVPAPVGPKGTFTLTTDREILTNNTRAGPTRTGDRRTLSWDVGGLDPVKPEALIGE